MIRVATIVEGHGEVSALPILLRRFGEWLPGKEYVEPLAPIRVHRDRFLRKEEEFRRQLLLAAAKCGVDGWILVILDADDDCPVELGNDVMQRARENVPLHRISVVLANREFEVWFIAAAASLEGHRGFSLLGTEIPADPDVPRDAKGWLRMRKEGGVYRETLDQPAFAATMDLQQAHDRSRSFRKLCKEWIIHIQERGA